MEPPEGYQVPQGCVCKLVESLYCLKHASRKWNEKFTEKIEIFGFTQSKHDYCLFTKQTNAGLISLLLYVDDILVTGLSNSHIMEVKRYLDRLFTIKYLGETRYFLGLEIARTSQGLIVTQTKYVTDLIKDMGLAHGSAPVSWKTKKQATVSMSTVEAEYRSMALVVCELTWSTYLLADLGVSVKLPVPFYCDNKATLHITENPVFLERTKHLEIDCYIVQNSRMVSFDLCLFLPNSK
ncbi:UNVERIFIED_CONTAM: Retrovirus-related Pol polyprotein from transposon RE1 [Sesamum latifolium]|uniref:Retrovirus-related Pol polyprotein from transposon RE1 n=1 Tax=Sesamum latifolium TaxID=2727402 RepID=A0AAW2WSR5_9LAMI